MIKNVTREDAIKNFNLIVPIAYNEIFLEIFGNPKNVVFTEYLVSGLLRIPYEEIKGKIKYYLRSSPNINIYKKKMEKDIVFLVNIDNPYICNLEMNLNDLTNIKIERNIGYAFDIVSNMLKPGEVEKRRKRFIQFNFNTVFVDKENKIIYDDYNYLNNKLNILSKGAEISHINIAKMSNMWYDKTYKKRTDILSIVFWFGAVIMENEKSRFKELIDNAPIDKKVAKKLESEVLEMNSDEGLYGRYFNREEEDAYWRAVEREDVAYEAEQKGISIGSSQERENNIINLYNNGASLDLITKSLGLKLSEVKKIIENNNLVNKK